MMFKGKVVAITGAAGGIGQSLCTYFAAEGATIAAIDRSGAVEAFAKGLGVAHAIADVGEPDAATLLVLWEFGGRRSALSLMRKCGCAIEVASILRFD